MPYIFPVRREVSCVVSQCIVYNIDTEQYYSVMFTSYTDAKCNIVQNKEQHMIMVHHTACNKRSLYPFLIFSVRTNPTIKFLLGILIFPQEMAFSKS